MCMVANAAVGCQPHAAFDKGALESETRDREPAPRSPHCTCPPGAVGKDSSSCPFRVPTLLIQARLLPTTQTCTHVFYETRTLQGTKESEGQRTKDKLADKQNIH